MAKRTLLCGDPIIEHEKLSKLAVMEPETFRFTKTKLFLGSDYKDNHIELRQKKHGGIECHVWTEQFVKTSETRSCDMGHRHPVLIKDRVTVFGMDLSVEQVNILKKFLDGTHMDGADE